MRYVLILLVTSITFSAWAITADLEYTETTRVPQSVYIPTGFDNNDSAELAFEGFFPNACYKAGLTHHYIDELKNEIYISDMNYFHEGIACARIIVPYVKEARFGILKKGKYKIFFKDSKGAYIPSGNLNVAKAPKDSVDNYLYAPIEQATFNARSEGKEPTLTLQGHFYNECMEMDRVEVYLKEESNTVDILPITKLGVDMNCAENDQPIPFKEVVPLSMLPEGRLMLHIRSLNGKAVNKIVNL